MSSSFSSHQSHYEFLKLSNSTLNKHEVIQKFKESQKQKSILKNKLNILQEECLKYQRKAKSIQSEFKKVNKIKEKYQRNKAQIQEMLQKNKEKEEEKIQKVKQTKQENKGKLPMIKYWLEREKSNDSLLVKQKSKDIEHKIRVYRNSVVSQRRKTAHRIKEEQQMVPFNRTLYMQLKQKNARMHEEEEALQVERKFKKSRMEFEHMKNLEDSLLEKLNKSRTKFNQSMTKIGKSIRA